MAQTVALVETIKRCLKQQKITYHELAEKLDLSEANVKRMFSKRNFTLSRLDEICQVLEMEITDVIMEMSNSGSTLNELSEEQERELVSDNKLVLVTFLVVNQWTFEEILANYNLKPTELIQLLAKLDRMRFIDLLPGNRVRLLISRNFRWIPKGPVYQFFVQNIPKDFFHCDFEPMKGELLLFFNGLLSKASNKQMQRSMHRLAQEFDELNREDAKLPLNQRYGSTLVVAMRPWELEMFKQFRHAPNPKFEKQNYHLDEV